MVPSEDPDYGDLGQAFPPWPGTARGAILQPLKPEIRPCPQVLERAADRDADREAADRQWPGASWGSGSDRDDRHRHHRHERTTRRCSAWPPGARSPTSPGKPPTSSPPTTPRYSRPPCARITPVTLSRATLGKARGHLVARMVSELRSARVHARHGPDQVRTGQAPALGGRLLRAPHQPSRPSPPPRPQHCGHQFDHGSARALTGMRTNVRIPVRCATGGTG